MAASTSMRYYMPTTVTRGVSLTFHRIETDTEWDWDKRDRHRMTNSASGKAKNTRCTTSKKGQSKYFKDKKKPYKTVCVKWHWVTGEDLQEDQVQSGCWPLHCFHGPWYHSAFNSPSCHACSSEQELPNSHKKYFWNHLLFFKQQEKQSCNTLIV